MISEILWQLEQKVCVMKWLSKEWRCKVSRYLGVFRLEVWGIRMICTNLNHHLQNYQTRHWVWGWPSKCPSYFWEEKRRRNCLRLHLHPRIHHHCQQLHHQHCQKRWLKHLIAVVVVSWTLCHQRFSFACRTLSKHNKCKCRMSIVIFKKR